jgi:hypothetical protein
VGAKHKCVAMTLIIITMLKTKSPCKKKGKAIPVTGCGGPVQIRYLLFCALVIYLQTRKTVSQYLSRYWLTEGSQ